MSQVNDTAFADDGFVSANQDGTRNRVDRRTYISRLLGATADEGTDEYQKQSGSSEFEGGGEFETQLEDYIKKDHPSGENLAKLADLQPQMAMQLKMIMSYHDFFGRKQAQNEFYTFEPHTFTEKLKALNQNMSENWTIILTVILCFLQPSLISIGFMILTFDLNISSKMAAVNRLNWGIGFMYLNIATLVFIICWKIRKVQTMINDSDSIEVFKREIIFYQSTGFTLFNLVKDDVNSVYTFQFDPYWSFSFEFMLMIVYFFAISNFYKRKRVINQLRKNQINVALIKSHEFRDYYESDSESDEDQPDQIQIGSKDQRQRMRELMLNKEKKKKHKKLVEDLARKTERNFMDCRYFMRMNKWYFMLLIICQLVQAMTFNGLLDIPTLLLILMLLSLFAFREQAVLAYGLSTIFIVYLIHFIICIKIIFNILSAIDYVQLWFMDNQSSPKVQLLCIIFGLKIDKAYTEKDYELYLLQDLMYLSVLYLAQGWKQCKWCEVRDFCQAYGKGNANSIEQLVFYLSERQRRKDEDRIHKECARQREEQLKMLKLSKFAKKNSNKKTQFRLKYGNIDLLSEIKRSINKYLPTVIVWNLRIMLMFQSYMYHNSLSLIHICWVVISFILPMKGVLFISQTVMLPIYTWEFVMIYGLRVPIINQMQFFKDYGSYFNWQFHKPILEQLLYYAILTHFFMTISCFKLTFSYMQNAMLIELFETKIQNRDSSILWKFSFFALKKIQTIVLICLFLNGSNDLNHVRNLGIMIFFVIYTTYENLYRKTSRLLNIFFGIFIVLQYYFSLVYHKYEHNKILMRRLSWFNVYNEENKPTWKEGDSIYFRHTPYLFDWGVLILMSMLNIVNFLFTKKKIASDLEHRCWVGIRDRYSKNVYGYIRFKNRFTKIFQAIVIVVLIYFLGKAETNIINSFFFIFILCTIALIGKNDNKESTIKWTLKSAAMLKIYGAFILISTILFIIFIGNEEKVEQPKSLDQLFKRQYPFIYAHLDLIGFREYYPPNEKPTADMRKMALKYKFFEYIIFLMIGIYFSGIYEQRLEDIRGEMSFSEGDYKNLFEFEEVKKLTTQDMFEQQYMQHLQTNRTTMRRQSTRQGLDDDWEAARNNNIEAEYAGKFVKKKTYNKYDLLDHFENRRYTTEFQVYRMMDYWPVFDFFATYGHILNNFIIVYIACNFSVSFFMAMNLMFVCSFYAFSSFRLAKRAMKDYNESGLQSQTDLSCAYIITKKFKIGAHFEFLEIRKKVWRVQFAIIVLMACIGFPSTLMFKIRAKLNVDPVANAEGIDRIDHYTFYMFMTGIYKDHRHWVQVWWYYTFFMLTIGLLIERYSINWLTNRMGCNYNKLQKFIELDLRKQAIDESWEIMVPKYSIDSYKPYYFLTDFDELKKRFQEDHQDSRREQKKAKENQEVRDYIPYKVAKRVRDMITFAVKLNGRCPDLQIDDNTRSALDEIDKRNQHREEQLRIMERQGMRVPPGLRKEVTINDYDIELSEPQMTILVEQKIKFLGDIIKQAVDRKYKISFHKGIQMVFENIICLVLMVSVVLKANVFSLIYLIFIVKFIQSKHKTQLLVRLVQYTSICLFIQYLLFVLNLTDQTSPAPFPSQFFNYPEDHFNKTNYKIRFWFPLFFQSDIFRDLKLSYLIGVGLDQDQIQNIILDFFNLYLVSMYVMNYRNPVLVKSMQKVFWVFPSTDNPEQWMRLNPEVRKQVLWLIEPFKHTDQYFKTIRDENTFNSKQRKLFHRQYHFAEKFQQLQSMNLNDVLINYVDLKYQAIWSEDFLKKVKSEFKELSLYFRIVKQGSVLTYLSFHIFTILMVLLMATLRQSIMSLGYVLILLPRMKDGSEVLMQREIHQDSQKNHCEATLEQLETEHQEIQKQMEINIKDENKVIELERQLDLIQEEMKEHRRLLNQFNKDMSVKTRQQKEDERTIAAQKQWKMIKVVSVYLLTYACVDFISQIVAQLPVFDYTNSLEIIGFRKVWVKNKDETFTYREYVNDEGNFQGLSLNIKNLIMQCMNCVMICSISLQKDIFNSPGYQKYVTQSNGSMDLLMQLSELKCKSIAFRFNNAKIRKIIQVQKKKELILLTVEKVKEKIKRWRQFCSTTLDINKGKSQSTIKRELTQQLEMEQQSSLNRQFTNESDVRQLQIDETPRPSVADTVDFSNFIKDKQVNFDEDQVDQHIKSQLKKVSPEMADKIFENLAKEFVQAKMEKLNSLTQWYLYFNKNWTNQILFKNKKEDLQEIVRRHAMGEVFIPTELEKIMLEEAESLIRQKYDNKNGAQELLYLIHRANGAEGKKLLEITNFDKKIKLKQMPRTWDFTRRGSMIMKLVETLFYVVISNTQNFIYLCMMYSMFQNAGIISIIYPFMLFGYALIEETRPTQEFWNFLRTYTQWLLMLKFFINLSIFGDFMATDTFQTVTGYLKVGIYDYDSLHQLVIYMLPEILIITFIMLNEIHLRLIGLYYTTEDYVETIDIGIQRNLEHGDEEKVRQKKIAAANMQLAQYFDSLKDQKYQLEEAKKIETYEFEQEMKRIQLDGVQQHIEQLDEMKREFEERQNKILTHEEEIIEQDCLLKSISNNIYKSSQRFDVDSFSNQKNSQFDMLVKYDILQKHLECDDLLYVEGKMHSNKNQISREEFQDMIDEENALDTISAADFQEEMEEKQNIIEQKNTDKLDVFEKSQYFDRVFPSQKIQKPGYDLYGSTTTCLGIIAIFVFLKYGELSVDQSNYLNNKKNSSNIFKGDMATCLLIVIFTIILERYVNRTDTKPIVKKGLAQNENSFFKQDQLLKRSSTARSMTIKLKTMKTADLDVQDSSAQEYLRRTYGDLDDDDTQFENTRTKITTQQKCKYIMHWTLLILAHVMIFWVIPITGNYKLYATAKCDRSQQTLYGCKNFKENYYLRVFYFLLCIYFTLSALQMRYGFPIMKKPSSVLQYDDNPLALIGANIYYSIPFAIELRCLLDFTLSKTALDNFQFWQLFNYHMDFYLAKNGNVSYIRKILGEPITFLDKFIFGWLITSIVLLLLVGPFIFFSDIGGFTAPNPVQKADISMEFIINKQISTEDLIEYGQMNSIQSLNGSTAINVNKSMLNSTDHAKALKTRKPYLVYSNKNPFLRQYDQAYYKNSIFNKWTETRFFSSDQIQDCIASEYSDESWGVSYLNRLQLAKDMAKAVNASNHDYNFTLDIHYSFDRNQPQEAKTVSAIQKKTLNYSEYHDCMTGQALKKLASIDCSGGKSNSQSVQFIQAINPNLILGGSKSVETVVRKTIDQENQQHDLILTFSCPDQWMVRMSANPTVIPESKWREVDPATCEPIHSKPSADQKSERKSYDDYQNMQKTHEATQIWQRVKFTLFSMMVSASFFASYNVTTFYTGVMMVASTALRPVFLYNTWRGYLYETTTPDPIIKVIECCYLKRHEEDLVGEEEAYRLLQEIIRSPELIKALSGSCLKGSADPLLDKYENKPEVIKKIQHLDNMERKGFDVEKLKLKVLGQTMEQKINMEI